MSAAVTLKGISKAYRTYASRQQLLKELFSFGRRKVGRDFWALDNVDLTVQPGTALGILGRNGAGKSTLLSIVSGVLRPTSGTREVNGRLAALLQLGAGFNGSFTGRENVMMNGLILGIDRREMMERFDEIAEFADIGEFMERPVNTYSSGMRARLGFAVAVSVEPDVLVVDETLSVGDAIFKHSGLRRMRELRDSGTTIMFVSHSMGMVRDFCSEAALLHEGRLLAHGEAGETIDRYQALLSQTKAQKSPDRPDGSMGYEIEEEDDFDPDEGPASWGGSAGSPRLRHGTREARILGVDLLDEAGNPTEEVGQDSRVTIRVRLEYAEAVDGGAVGIALRNKAGIEVFSTDTRLEGIRLGPRRKGERLTVDFTVETPLRKGTYDIAASVSHPESKNLYMDWLDISTIFKVSRRKGVRDVPGLVRLPTSVELHDGEEDKRKIQRPSKSA